MAMTSAAMAVTSSAARPQIDPQRYAVEVFGLEKRFLARKGLPPGFGMGSAHWIISSLLMYQQTAEWVRAVNGVDLKVERGEVLGVLGPNGAGKTTLIKCLATLLDADGGDAFINGFSVRTQPAQVRLSINLVGSGHWGGFDWGLTIYQNLEFFASLYGMDKALRRERIGQVLDRLGLARFANATPRTLSTGERQRMLLAKGFMIRTPVFFLDEPTVGLDPVGSREVREFLKKELIGNTGTSAILTTHRMPEAESLCRRIAILDRGRVVACGTPWELKRRAGQSAVLEVRAIAIPPGAVQELQQLAGVRAAVAAPVGDSVEESLRVHCEEVETIEGTVVDLLRRHGTEVRSVEIQEPNLEDAFMALTDRRLE